MNLIAEIAMSRTTISLGLLALLLIWESVYPFYAIFDLGRRRFLHALAIRFVFLALWLRTMQGAEARGFGLLHWLAAPDWLRWPLAVLLLDAWTYAWHRLNHTIPFFWRFHRLHHSDRQMDVTTANRFHLGEITFSSLFRVPLLALIGCRLEELALYELMLFTVVQFHHANIGLPEWLDRALRSVIVTPHMHKVHHSVVFVEQNSNFSSLLSWWDRLAHTLRLAPDLRRIVFGLKPGQT